MAHIDDPLIAAVEDFRASGSSDTADFERLILMPFTANFERIAEFMMWRSSMLARVDPETVLQLIYQAAWELLCSDTPTQRLDAAIPSSGFVKIMRRRVAQLARAESERAPRNGLAGTTMIRRRAHSISIERQRLAGVLMREPSDDEVIDSHNERMLATRKNAAKQGALVSHDDLRPPTLALTDDMSSLDRAGSAQVDGTDAIDLESMMDDIIARCDEMDDLSGQVARCMLGAAPLGDVAPSGNVIAREVGCTPAEARRAIRDVQQATIEVLDDYAGAL